MNVNRKLSSIHARLLLTTLIPLTLLSVVLGWYIITSQRTVLLNNLHDTGRVAAHQMGSNAEFALFSGNKTILEALGYSLLDIPSVTGVLFFNEIDKSTFIVGEVHISSELMLAELDSGVPLFVDNHWYFYAPITFSGVPVMDYDEDQPEVESLGWVVVGLTNKILLYEQREAIFGALVVTTLSLLIAAWLSMRIGRSISRPVESLTETVEIMEAGSLDSLAAEDGPTEIRKLAYGINQLAISVRESNVRTQSEIARATAQLQITLIELEEAMEAQDQFLARMSHELRTPLTAVIGFSKLLGKETNVDKRQEHLRVIANSSTMLLTMIDDILEFSKAHFGGFSLEKINFDMSQWFADLVAIHRPSADEKKLSLSYKIADDVPNFLCGDPVRLAQIISNLISNAIKFTDYGFVKVDIKCGSYEGDAVVLDCVVSDSGKGIERSKIPGLFDPFSQEDTSINRRFGGTGLGLSICKRLVNTMGGEINIESEVGSGTKIRFTCRLSAVDSESNAGAGQINGTSQLPEQVLSGVTVLLAEDNLFNQKLIVKLLRGYGADCLVANNGLEAIEIAGDLHIDVVLMDIHMPVVDGVTACEAIMEQSGDSLPIIGLTADITPMEQQRMLTAGAISVQAKPVDEVKLLNSILNSLDDLKTLSPNAGGGLLASVIPVEELKNALYENLDKLEVQLRSDEKVNQRQIIHDLMGLCGLYGMSELRTLVLQFRVAYGTRNSHENIEQVRQIRDHIEAFLVPTTDNS
jgi:two-component system sensor histidine kinase BarA